MKQETNHIFLYVPIHENARKKATKIHTDSSSCLWEGEQLGGSIGQVNGVFTFWILL